MEKGQNYQMLTRRPLCDKLFRSTLADNNSKLYLLSPGKTNHTACNLRHDQVFELPFINTDRFKHTVNPGVYTLYSIPQKFNFCPKVYKTNMPS